MIIQLDKNIDATRLERIKIKVTALGYKAAEVQTQRGSYLVAIGKKEFDIRDVGHLTGVQDVHIVSDAFKLVSKKWKAAPTAISVGDGVTIEAGGLSLIAGPCSVESEEQMEAIAKHLKENNVTLMRGGAFKPRTSPYSFQGLGLEGLKLFHGIASAYGIKVVSEVVAAAHIEPMYDYVDIYQVGTRNTQNFNLLHELGKVDKPVLLKRGMSGTLEDLLQSAEYVFSNGNEKLILCERGIRTFEKAYRNTLDLNAIPVLKEKSHLPVIADPSHGMGIRKFVEPVALAMVTAGADGLIFEVHEKPEEALSDGQQTLYFEDSARLIRKARALKEFIATY
ncbi:bifunctional 3-deoxy-7-phosphoheptulonate synthase/chorismate mutase [Oligoflexia bacterium]|nr:bifunctional 3-deoxy-7-phosphoheptulonate synthase/chorismate mutase [Oligoflexia bacterium]